MPVSTPLAHHTMGAAVDQNVSVIESNENNNWTQIGFS